MTGTGISDEDIRAAIRTNDDPGRPGAWTSSAVRRSLGRIDEVFEASWGEHMNAVEGGDLEVIAETPAAIVFADHSGDTWNEVLDGLDLDPVGSEGVLQSVLVKTHHNAAIRRTGRSPAGASPLVVGKPGGFEAGRRFVEAVVNGLQSRGLSPGQSWAYYSAEIRESAGAARGGHSGDPGHGSVSDALENARERLIGSSR